MRPDIPFTSVIILGHNGVEYLDACLRSALDQDHPRDRYEVIYADNESSDGSLDLVERSFPSVRTISLGANHGFARGNNLAANEAEGELLAFLNQDTVVGRSWLSALVAALAEGQLQACQSNIVHPRDPDFAGIENRSTPERVYFYEFTRFGHVEQVVRHFQASFIACTFLSGASFIVERSAVNALGYLFDESLGTYCEDTELSLRLSGAGYRAGVAPRSVVYHLGSFDAQASWRNVWKHMILSRNRFLAFWRALPKLRFVQRLPLLLLSHPVKVYSRARRMEHGLFRTTLFVGLGSVASVGGFFWFAGTLASLSHAPVGGIKEESGIEGSVTTSPVDHTRTGSEAGGRPLGDGPRHIEAVSFKKSWSIEWSERLFDIGLALFGFVAFLPVAVLITIAILMEDGRPIFYSQVRVGRYCKSYRLWKFRSMIKNAEEQGKPVRASKNDARITRVGRVLRQTGMDELPQLWSILRGDMSFVGPRSYREHFVNEFREQVKGYDLLFSVRPGLTGLAQIYGPKKPTALQKWRLDLLYLQRRSPWLDLRLILLSGWITLRRRWDSHDGKI